MAKTVLGIFNDRSDVEDAINKLQSKGFNPKDVSIVMKDQTEAHDIGNDTGASVAKGALTGVGTGAVVGGLAGFLAGTVLPGLGGLLIGGPIGAALGLSGAAATTVSGAATGAVAGGLIGALMGFGLTHEEAEHYQTKVKEGAILVAVPARDDDVSYVTDVFDIYHASDVKAVSQTSEKAQSSTSHHYADRDEMHNKHAHEQHTHQESHGHQHATSSKNGSAAQDHSRTVRVNPIQVEKYLKGVDYPCSKDELVKTAEREGADDNVIQTLEDMPGKSFNSPNDVSQAIGDMR